MNVSTSQNANNPVARHGFAEVALNLAGRASYTYSIPDELMDAVAPGVLVSVPIGERAEIGCVLELSHAPRDVDVARVRPINAIASPEYRINAELMALGAFISSYYFCTPGEALAAISVVGFKDVRTQQVTRYSLRHDWRAIAGSLPKPLRPAQIAACEKLEAAGFPIDSRTGLARAAECSASIVSRLIDFQILLIYEEQQTTLAPVENTFTPALRPNEEQEQALGLIHSSIDNSTFGAYLLHGITGSGKTEVYLQAMSYALERGRTALCLVPEISLTPQTLDRFEKRFCQEIGVFHSQMSRRAKLELYHKIQDGRVRVVIGARSAVFAPLPNLGIIVLDEEHDHSYKQGETPRYHARDMAIVRAQKLGIPVILGSATPSLESYRNAQTGKYTLIKLTKRHEGAELPPVTVVDLTRESIEHTMPSLFSEALLAAIRERLARNEQTILFLNRRGFSNFLFCPSCKWVARCDEDDVALTVHRTKPAAQGATVEMDLFTPAANEKEHHLRCHFCGARSNMPEVCPACKSDGLMSVGAGTQRVEQELATLFPNARLLRMDYDSVGGREGFLRAWKQMVEGDADIILGTQMIAKGLHLERVTLVGVVLADVGLFLPDFRADERTFQLLAQVAGRAGRTTAGEVIFQTYMPKHTAIRYATRHDYEGFYAEEELRRRQWNFPPFKRMIAITLSDPDREKAFKAARLLSYILSRSRSGLRLQGLSINGPTIAPISRLAGRFRYRVLLRGDQPGQLARLLKSTLSNKEWQISSTTRITIDVDPVDLL